MEGEKKREITPDPSETRKKKKTSKESEAELNEQTPEQDDKDMASSSLSNDHTVATSDMCVYCFDVIVAHHFKKMEKPSPTFTNDSYPLFVTWYIGRDKRLRGCIGTFTSMNLHKGIKEYALTSAMGDSRFSPVTKQEISQLSVSVSLLVDFENGNDYLDWTVGTHGIKIEFSVARSTKTATFLPQVAPEQGWDKEATIEALLRKAGVRGTISQSMKDGIKLVRYRSEQVEMNFQDYVKCRQHVPELLNGCYTPYTNGH